MNRRAGSRFGGFRPCLVAAAVALTALAGCGRKGPLELPPDVPQTTQTPGAATVQANRILPITDDPGLVQPPGTFYQQTRSAATQNLKGPINAPVPSPPAKRFILDPLL